MVKLAVKRELKKVLQSGSQGSLVGLRKLGGVIAEVASSLKRERPKYILTVPKHKRIGKVFYTVQSAIEPVTFTKRKDAVHFKKLLKASTGEYPSDIVRREITDDGYHL